MLCERQTNGTQGAVPGDCVRSCPTLSVTALLTLFARWHAAHQSAWGRRPSPTDRLWTLPVESPQTARTISTWFAYVLGVHLDCCRPFNTTILTFGPEAIQRALHWTFRSCTSECGAAAPLAVVPCGSTSTWISSPLKGTLASLGG